MSAVAILSAVLLLARGIAGPFWIVHNPLNAEIALALATLAALFVNAQPDGPLAKSAGHSWLPLLLIPLAAAIAFLPILSMPLITDDYVHIQQISTGLAPTPLGCLTHSCGGPNVFRPLGFATYWAEWGLWGTAALPRHAFDLILHGLCSALFLLLVRRLGVVQPFDWLAGLLFAWDGIRPEAVAWPGARFDTLALLFGLAAALCALRGGRSGLLGALLCTAAACLSKESGYMLPVLLALLLGAKAFTRAGRILAGSSAAVAVAIFVWRWAVLRGIGGYMQQDGVTPNVLQFHPLTLLKTFLGRIWGVLWFPLNWSRPPEWWVMLALCAGAGGTLLLLRSRPSRARIGLCVAGVVVACLPTHHLLLIDASLERARYLDLATPAFLLLLVFACSSLPRREGIAALALLVTFQLAALEHNLRIWSDVSRARYAFCQSLAEQARATANPLILRDVPVMREGVYWRNGIEACLLLEFGIPLGKVQVVDPAGGLPDGARPKPLPE